MPVVAADPSHRGSTGMLDREGDRSYSVLYNVEVDDYTDGPVTILEYFRTTGGLPWLNDSYVFYGDADLSAYCSKITPQKQQGSTTEWTVRVDYNQLSPRTNENGTPVADPLDVGRQFSFGFATRQQPVEIGIWNGTNYILNNDQVAVIPLGGFYEGKTAGTYEVVPTNSAGDVFDPPLLEDLSDLMFMCSMNLASFDADVARTYKDGVNDKDLQLDLSGTIYQTTFHVYKYQMKCINIGATFTASSFTDGAGASVNRFFWDTQYEFHIRDGLDFGNEPPKGWLEWVVDRGYNRSARTGDPDGKGGTIGAIQPGQPLVERVRGLDKMPVSEPTMLDGSGQPLAGTDTARYQEFQNFKLVAMESLPVGFTTWTPP